MIIEEKTIQEKALKLAEYDGYNKKCHISESIEELQKECIKEYSSFDKLMEFYQLVNCSMNKKNLHIRICPYIVELVECYFPPDEKVIDFWTTVNNKRTLKECLMDCLLKYYELTKGD